MWCFFTYIVIRCPEEIKDVNVFFLKKKKRKEKKQRKNKTKTNKNEKKIEQVLCEAVDVHALIESQFFILLL